MSQSITLSPEHIEAKEAEANWFAAVAESQHLRNQMMQALKRRDSVAVRELRPRMTVADAEAERLRVISYEAGCRAIVSAWGEDVE